MCYTFCMKKKTIHLPVAKMFFLLSAFLLSFCFVSCTSVKNSELLNRDEWKTNYTYVFVHGLSGWGHYDSINNFFPYWGMKSGSLFKRLKKCGFDVHDASVAPQGSAWDRACELYAQLTGSRTDYGAEHSKRAGHERFGRDFSKEPLIKQWDSEHKINLFGHSFGGVTVRLLAHLMAEGSEAERNATAENELSPLFAGGHADWIYSVTTLAAPHNGTSAYHIPDPNPQEKTGMQKMMDKRSAPREDGRASFDNAAYDMHLENAREINSWLSTIKEAFYFSYSCYATLENADGIQVPEESIMENLFERTSARMGAFEGTAPDGTVFTKDWQKNDGLVNTISALAPDFSYRYDFSDEMWKETPSLQKGVWYVMPLYHGDHMSLQGGLTIKNPGLGDFYLKHMNLVNSL